MPLVRFGASLLRKCPPTCALRWTPSGAACQGRVKGHAQNPGLVWALEGNGGWSLASFLLLSAHSYPADPRSVHSADLIKPCVWPGDGSPQTPGTSCPCQASPRGGALAAKAKAELSWGRRSLSAQWLTRNKSRRLGTGCHARQTREQRAGSSGPRFLPCAPAGHKLRAQCWAGGHGALGHGDGCVCPPAPCRVGATDSPVPVYGGPAGPPPGKQRLQPKVPCCPARADTISVLKEQQSTVLRPVT